MRPETKERADTIIGSALRASFTFYQATAGDMGTWGVRELRGAEPEERRGSRHQKKEKKKEMSWFSVCKHLSQAEIILLVEMGI